MKTKTAGEKVGKWAGAILWLLLFTLAPLLTCSPASALTVTGVVQTAQSAQRTNVLLTFTPLNGPVQSLPGVFTTSESVYTRSGTNAAWSISLAAGWYGMKVGTNPKDVAVLAVTNGSGTVGYSLLSTNLPLYVYNVAPWDLASGSSYLPGSNVSFTTNGDGTITISATLTGGAATLGDITNVFASLSGASFSNFVGLARFNGYSNALVSIAYASDAATSNQLTALSYTIGSAATNYTLTTSNALLTLALAANTATSNQLTTLAYSIGANSTNFALAIGTALTNLANSKQFGSLLLSNAVASGRIVTNGFVAGSNVTLSTNAGGDITITATLSGGAATLGDITNVFANLSGPGQSNFISSVRLAGSNYVNQTAADATFQASTNYANAIGTAATNKANAIGSAATNAIISQGAANTNHATSILQSATNNALALRTIAPIGTNAGAPFFLVTNANGQIVGFANTNAFPTSAGSSFAPTVMALATTNIVFSTATNAVFTITLKSNTTFSASGYASGAQAALFITGDTVTRTVSFPGWTWLEGNLSSVTSNKVYRVDLLSLGTTATNVSAVYGGQQ